MRRLLIFSLFIAGLAFADTGSADADERAMPMPIMAPVGDMADGGVERATFAGGCFWCMEKPFDDLPGVSATIVGYMGGDVYNPTYDEVTSGETGHAEVVMVLYDPNETTYQQLLDVFWRQIDPTDADGQFIDRGSQYRTGIFYHSPEQQELAEQSKEQLQESERYGDKEIVTSIEPVDRFWRAEEYHQNFYRTNEYRYKYYRYHSGRDQYLDRIWSDER